MDEYLLKLHETFLDYLESTEKPNILEFGVRHGISTKMFIDICERKDGFLNSVDVDNYSKKFLSKKSFAYSITFLPLSGLYVPSLVAPSVSGITSVP